MKISSKELAALNHIADLYEEAQLASSSDFNRGVEFAEQRIIKLLEELKGPEIACCDDCRPYAERSANYLDAVIALIKGEK